MYIHDVFEALDHAEIKGWKRFIQSQKEKFWYVIQFLAWIPSV